MMDRHPPRDGQAPASRPRLAPPPHAADSSNLHLLKQLRHLNIPAKLIPHPLALWPWMWPWTGTRLLRHGQALACF
jgi:hypothetical protein